MGRATHGWKLRPPAGKRTTYSVRFWHGGRQVERSTGQSTRGAAARAAARIYAAAVQAKPEPARARRRASTVALAEVIAQWLEDLPHAASTCETWDIYGGHFLDHFERTENLTSERAADYIDARLRKVQAQTVRKEASALRSLTRWAQRAALISWTVTVPSVPKRALGNRQHAKRKRAAAVELSPAEVRAIIAKLPEWSRKRGGTRWPIRARFFVAYETGLRPSTLDKLSVPEHYHRGARDIALTADADKGRYSRGLPLKPRVRKALDAVCPKAGLIFGAHDYRPRLERAVRQVLDKARADAFCGAHLRSARATHFCERSDNLAGVQYLMGHLRVSTTAVYVKASKRAAEDVLRKSR